jgi:Xaa-Pro aminopeptidase
MKKANFLKRLAALKSMLPEIKADTLWITQPENRRYFSGFKAEDTSFTESSGSLLINQKESLLVTDSRYTTEARKEAFAFEVVTLKKPIAEELPVFLRKLGTKVLGFETAHLTWELHRQVQNTLKRLSPPIRLTPVRALLENMRIIKDRDELRAMAAASQLMGDILEEIISHLRTGVSEKSLAWEIEGLVREGGAEGLAFPSIVASGPNSALPHAVPTERKIRAGEPITLDVGLRMDGYCCDMTRTVFIDAPKPAFKKIYRTVREAQLAGLDAVRSNVMSDIPDKAARDIIEKTGYGLFFGHALGHGVGLAAHESPRLAPRKPELLREGMVVTVEPGIYIPHKGGVRLEEMVAIGKKGIKILTQCNYLYDF